MSDIACQLMTENVQTRRVGLSVNKEQIGLPSTDHEIISEVFGPKAVEHC